MGSSMSSRKSKPVPAAFENILGAGPAPAPPQLTEAALERHLHENFPILSARAREQGITISELVRRTLKEIDHGGPLN